MNDSINSKRYQSMKLNEINALMNDSRNIDELIDAYVTWVDDNDVEIQFTQRDVDESFVRIPTPKANHNKNLVPIVLVTIR